MLHWGQAEDLTESYDPLQQHLTPEKHEFFSCINFYLMFDIVKIFYLLIYMFHQTEMFRLKIR